MHNFNPNYNYKLFIGFPKSIFILKWHKDYNFHQHLLIKFLDYFDCLLFNF